MRLLFTHSYFYRLDPKQWRDQRPYPPLGTLQASTVAREMGHDVSLHDNGLEPGPEALIARLEVERPDVLFIYDDGFNYLTKMCLTVMRDAAFRMIGAARSLNIPVFLNSSDSTDHWEKYLETGATGILQGEGEATLAELIDRLNSGSDWSDLEGLAHLGNGEAIANKPRAVIRDLDTLTPVAWELIDLQPYREIWMRSQGFFSLNMATTRGCPFKCNWCAKPIYGNRYNVRSPKRAVQEMVLLRKTYAVDHIWFADDIFGLKPGWAQQFRDELNKEDIKIPFKIQSRADLLLHEDTIDALAEAGLDEVWIGAESGSQKILDAMDKGITVEQIRNATALLRNKRIKVCFFLQFGYLGETTEDVDLTIRMVEELVPDDIGISVSYPLPGTKFYDLVKEQLKGKANWTDSDDLSMMFEHRYGPGYYKRLHRYVHKRYRRKQATKAWRKLTHDPSRLSREDARRALSFFYYAPATAFDRWRSVKLRTQTSEHSGTT